MEWLTYLLKVSACSVLFFAFYLVVLRKLTFFRANRFYLLFSLLLSFVIPALNVEVEKVLPPLIVSERVQTVQPVLQQHPMAQAHLPAPQIDWSLWLGSLYLVVVAALLGLGLWRVLQLLKHTSIYKRIDGLKLIHKKKGFTNCSFFNYVFIDSNELTPEEICLLLKHEEVHAKQYHSADKLLLLVAKAVLWFNPVIYFYDKELEQLHEYEADESTSSNFGTKFYANLLLKLAVQENSVLLVHNFVKSPIKERIKMLYQSKSRNMKKLSYVLALPIATALVWGFAVNIVYAQEKIIQGQNVPVKEVPVVTVKGIKADKVISSNNDVVVKKASGKTTVAGVEANTVNDVVIVAKGTSIGGQQIATVNGDAVARGVGNTISVVGTQNDVAVISKVQGMATATGMGQQAKISDVVIRGNSAVGSVGGKSLSDVKTIGAAQVNDVVITGRSANIAGTQARGGNDVSVGNFNVNRVESTGHLFISKEKISLVIDKNTTKKQLEQYQAQLKEKNIDLKIKKIETGADDKITYVEIAVDCNDGFKGSVGGSPIKNDNVGFYRVYTKNSSSPFGVGSGDENE